METFLKALAPVWTPHPGQREALLARAKLIVLACGRRWGKTEAAAVRLLNALRRPNPVRALIVAPTLDQAQILFGRVLDFFAMARERCGLFVGDEPKVKHRPYPELRLGPHTLSARSGHVERNLRGREADEIVVDEAAFVEESLIEDVLYPMLATTGGSMTLISTPCGFNHFFRYFQRGQAGHHRVWSRTAPSAENPALDPEFLRDRQATTPARVYRREYEAAFESVAGAVFPGQLLDQASLAADAPAAAGVVCVGIDFGQCQDHTAVVVVRGSRRWATVELATRVESGTWRDQLARIDRVLSPFPHGVIHCDATGVGSGIAEALRARYPGRVRPVVFTSGVKTTLVNQLATLFQDHALGLRPDPFLRDELSAYVAVELPSGHVRTAAAHGHDDLVMALALATKGLEGGYACPKSA